jgi:serine protease
VDPATGLAVTDATAVRQSDGSYAYTLSNVPAGSYEIFSGTDSNNNQFICDLGESCGAYITIDAPVLVEANQNRSGLDFVSGFTVNLADFKSVKASASETGIRRSSSSKRIGIAR